MAQLQATGAKVLMAGDGLNDAGALRKSQVGIAVMEGNSSFTPASDAIIAGAAFTNLANLLAFTQKARLIILISFIISITYNVIGLYFALQGQLAPVIAAILMPASTISIILITFFPVRMVWTEITRQ
ncbi:hypothetical protein LWM68_32535 [Niabella sp. W65]|nr:hypothetical protein [Niabella sp. W65]MCH7367076.1 hypothetical protein [Niabella sp. W65]